MSRKFGENVDFEKHGQFHSANVGRVARTKERERVCVCALDKISFFSLRRHRWPAQLFLSYY
jgi:hypothetical protein